MTSTNSETRWWRNDKDKHTGMAEIQYFKSFFLKQKLRHVVRPDRNIEETESSFLLTS